MGLYHSLDGNTNLKHKLLCFLTSNKKISKKKALAFNRDRCCHLVLCLWLILFHWPNTFFWKMSVTVTVALLALATLDDDRIEPLYRSKIYIFTSLWLFVMKKSRWHKFDSIVLKYNI
jgi:hypothetical protein